MSGQPSAEAAESMKAALRMDISKAENRAEAAEARAEERFAQSRENAVKFMDANRRAEQAEAEVARLRAALAPFGHPDLSKRAPSNVMGDDSVVWARDNAEITLGDFRRARAALARPALGEVENARLRAEIQHLVEDAAGEDI